MPTFPELLAAGCGQIHEAERSKAMIDRDQHNALTREILAIVHGQLMAGAGRVSAAVQPDDYRSMRTAIQGFGPNVQAQAVLIGISGAGVVYKQQFGRCMI
jgi:hypothetical protein